jgi:AcrR family transcriptional regulator
MDDRKPRPTLRERQRELTRRSIIDAAVEAFAEKGFVAVTADDFASRAGVSRATFYLYFSGKGEVLRALHDVRLTRWSELTDTGWTASDRESIRTFFVRIVAFYRESPVLYRTLHEARASDPEFAAAHRETMKADAAKMAAMGAVPDGDGDRLRVAVAMVYTMIDYFLHLWLTEGWELDEDIALDAMTDALYATLH